MKNYIGTKNVKAKLVTKQWYCDYRGWNVPEDEDPNEEIYLVEYEADSLSEPNHQDHKGYITMSPKHVFEQAYKISDTFKERLIIEKEKLIEKINGLRKGIESGLIPEEALKMLRVQEYYMQQYLTTLHMRIDDNDNPHFGLGEAVSLGLKRGKRIQRLGWNGKGLFVFMQVPTSISIKDVVPKMQSLPELVKEDLLRKLSKEGLEYINYANQLALVDKKGNVSGWSPSAADTLAEDWIILD